MCGRFALTTDAETLLKQFHLTNCEKVPVSYNVAPTENALCLVSNEAQISGIQMRWGLIPWYSKNSTGKKPPLLINARAETILEKPSFKQSAQFRRCLLIMNGFFEWQHHKNSTVKQPYFIKARNDELLAIAAIWQWYQPKNQEKIPSFCLLTTAAINSTVAKLHDRMPWMLSPLQMNEWLREEQLSAARLQELLKSDTPLDLIAYPVTQAVNSALYKENDSIKAKDQA